MSVFENLKSIVFHKKSLGLRVPARSRYNSSMGYSFLYTISRRRGLYPSVRVAKRFWPVKTELSSFSAQTRVSLSARSASRRIARVLLGVVVVSTIFSAPFGIPFGAPVAALAAAYPVTTGKIPTTSFANSSPGLLEQTTLVASLPSALSTPLSGDSSEEIVQNILRGWGEVTRRLTPKRHWVWPVDWAHTVTRGFHPPPPGAAKWASGYHRGVDLAAQPGSPVYAPDSGRVHFAGWVAGRPVISIDHGEGLISSLEPVTATVARGASVRRGQQIGTIYGDGHAGGEGWEKLPKKLMNKLVSVGAEALGKLVGATFAGPAGSELLGEGSKLLAEAGMIQSGSLGGVHLGARKYGVYINPLLFLGKLAPSVLLPGH